MTAAPVTIVCANCGAKYKLPADFKSASAKCKGCGATIDVAGQMKAAAAPAKAAGSTAKPVGSAAKPSAKPAAPAAKPATSARASREEATASRRDRTGATNKRPSSRRGSEEGGAEKKKSSSAMAIGSLVGIAGLGIASYFIFFSGGDKPATTPAADAPAASSPADKPMEKPDDAAAAAKAEADELAKSLKEDDTAAAKGEPDAKPADAAAKKGDDPAAKSEVTKELEPQKKPAAKPAEAKPPAKKGDEPKLTSMSEVFDAASLPPLTYPEDVAEELRKEIDGLADEIKNPGPSGRRAKRRLEEIGHPGMVGVINMYQKLDFKSSDQSTLQFDINKFLTNTYGAGVVSSSFRFVPPGEAITPDDANFNAKTVEAWRRFWTTYSDKDKWANFVKLRKDKGGAEEAIK
jgi:hypothetical protein